MRGCEHLVSSQVLQKTIDELRAITRIDLCVLSLEGQKVASTFSEEGFEPEYVREFVKSPADSQVLQAYHFFKIYDDQNVEYVLVTSGGSEDAYMIGKIAVCEIQNLIVAYKERLDKNNFIQNLLLDNLLLVVKYIPYCQRQSVQSQRLIDQYLTEAHLHSDFLLVPCKYTPQFYTYQ